MSRLKASLKVQFKEKVKTQTKEKGPRVWSQKKKISLLPTFTPTINHPNVGGVYIFNIWVCLRLSPVLTSKFSWN